MTPDSTQYALAAAALLLSGCAPTARVHDAVGLSIERAQSEGPPDFAIVGIVRNTGDALLEYGEVRCQYYDKAGVIVASEFTNFIDIPAGQSYKFHVTPFGVLGWPSRVYCTAFTR